VGPIGQKALNKPFLPISIFQQIGLFKVFIQCLGLRNFKFQSILSIRSRLNRAIKLPNFWQKNAYIFAPIFKINILLMKNDCLNKTSLSLTHQMVEFLKIMPKNCCINTQAAARVNQNKKPFLFLFDFFTGQEIA
jgi:hypothetical protein